VSDPVGDDASGYDIGPDPGPSGGAGMDQYMPESLPGYDLNTAIAGAYASPEGGGAVTDTLENEANVSSGTASTGFVGGGSDGFTSEMSPAGYSGTADANAALPQNLLGNLAQASGSPGAATPDTQAAPATEAQGIPGPISGDDSGQGIPPMGFTGELSSFGGPQGGPPNPKGGPPHIPPIQWNSGGGYLSAIVPNADESLASAVSSAASGGGGQAALMAGTVSLSGENIRAGGGTPVGSKNTPAEALIYGSEGGGAPQFHGGAHWFGPTVQAWYDAMVERIQAAWLAQQKQAGAGGGGGGGGGFGGPGFGGPGGGPAVGGGFGAGGGGFGNPGTNFNGAGGNFNTGAGGGFGPLPPGTGGFVPGGGGGTPLGGPEPVPESAGGGDLGGGGDIGGGGAPQGPNPIDATVSNAVDNSLSQWSTSGGGQSGGFDDGDIWKDPLGGVYSDQMETARGADSPDFGFEGLGHDPLSNTGGTGPGAPSEDDSASNF
jgi:hypothetical protein